MGIFDFLKSNRKKKKKTAFVKDPGEFITFLRSKDEDIIGFGANALITSGEAAVTPLIQLLTDEAEDIEVRRIASQILSEIEEPAIEPLLEHLKSGKADTEAHGATLGLVAGALGGMGEAVVEPLIRLLNDKGWKTRFGAATALYHTGDERAVQALRQAVKHEKKDALRSQYQDFLKKLNAENG